MLKGLKFAGTVEGSDGPEINENDQKVDTENVDDETQKKQQEAIDIMDDDADMSGDDSEDEDSDDSEEDDSSEDDEESEDEEDESDDSDEEDDESSEDEETEDKSDEDESDEDESKKDEEDSQPGEQNKPDRSVLDKKDVSKLSASERENLAIQEIYEKNKNILPPEFIDNWNKFQETGNNAFLHLNSHLSKLLKASMKTNEKLDPEERFQIGLTLAFKDEFSKQEIKKGQVKAEIANQKVNKSSSSKSSNSSKKNAKSYSADQIKMAKRMGVDLEKGKI